MMYNLNSINVFKGFINYLLNYVKFIFYFFTLSRQLTAIGL